MEKWKLECAARKEARAHFDRESKRIRRQNRGYVKTISALSDKLARSEANRKKLMAAVGALMESGTMTEKQNRIFMEAIGR